MDEHVNDVNAGKSEMEIGETDDGHFYINVCRPKRHAIQPTDAL